MDEGTQVFTLDVLHRDELHALRFAQVIDADDIPMSDLRGEDQLLLEALDDGGVSGVFAANRLQGDGAVQLDVPGFVDGPHAAFAEQRDDFVSLPQQIASLKDRLAAKWMVAYRTIGGKGTRPAGPPRLAGYSGCADKRGRVTRQPSIRRRAFPFEWRAHTTVPPFRGVVVRGNSSIVVDVSALPPLNETNPWDY